METVPEFLGKGSPGKLFVLTQTINLLKATRNCDSGVTRMQNKASLRKKEDWKSLVFEGIWPCSLKYMLLDCHNLTDFSGYMWEAGCGFRDPYLRTLGSFQILAECFSKQLDNVAQGLPRHIRVITGCIGIIASLTAQGSCIIELLDAKTWSITRTKH